MDIGFIDYSHDERSKILSTLKLLGDRGALDELGIGFVRDAYSDRLFPGISTIQTRAKYFVLLPYVFQNAEKEAEKGRLRNGREFLKWINEEEDRLAATLTKNCPSGETGIIGSDASQENRSVKMKPSRIYWNGLRTFGILRDSNASLSAVCRMLCAEARRKAETEIYTDKDSFDDPTAANQGNMMFVPLSQRYNYRTDATMDLTSEEAEFLCERIKHSVYTSGSLLDFFLQHRMISSDFDSVPAEMLPSGLRQVYCLAKDFSRFIYGAHIRYNVVFSEYSDQKMIDAFTAWREDLLSEPFELEPILDQISCPPGPAAFCRGFLDAVQRNDVTEMDDLIVKRELQVKNVRAKLRKPKEYRYDPENPIHYYRLEYRFSRASVIIRDILKGLEGG